MRFPAFLMAAAATCLSCGGASGENKNEIPDPVPEKVSHIHAVISGTFSKTEVVSGQVVWAAGDVIGLVDSEGNQVPAYLEGAGAGKAEGTFSYETAALKGTLVYAYYPYVPGAAPAPSGVPVDLPVVQTWHEGQFLAPNTGLMYGRIDADGIHFSHAVSVVEFHLTGSRKITELRLESTAALAGKGTLSTDGIFVPAQEGAHSISLDLGAGLQLDEQEETVVWFVLAPGCYADWKLVASSGGNRSVTLESSSAHTVAAGHIAPMSTLAVSFPVRVGILGDSISTFRGWHTDADYDPFYPDSDPNVGVRQDLAVDGAEKTWWYRVIYDYMVGAELDVNSSWQGTRVVHETKTGKSTGTTRNAGFVDRCLDFIEPDVVFIHGGTNDLNQGTELGSYGFDDPLASLDESRYRSSYVKTVRKIREAYPGVQVILIIGDRLGEQDSKYALPVIEIAQHYGLPYVDFRGDTIEKCKGSHPTAPAFDFMARKICSVCADVIPTVYTPDSEQGGSTNDPFIVDAERTF